MASLILFWLWIANTLAIALSGLLFLVGPKLPQFFQDLLLYGKARGERKEQTFVRGIEIPKRWFLHFYILGVVVNAFMFVTCVRTFIFGAACPQFVISIHDFFVGDKVITTGAGSATLVIMMMTIQNFRRLLECLFVSVYSKGTMNLLHYALGIMLYSTFSFVALCEAPSLSTYRVRDLHEEMHNPRHIVGFLLFMFATVNHHWVHEAFAALRKNKAGRVSTTDHRIPKGSRWFDYVSCPHYFMEILIYIAFQVVVGLNHITMMSVLLFVVVNQLVAGSISHQWYRQTFKTYPKQRKAVIPFLF